MPLLIPLLIPLSRPDERVNSVNGHWRQAKYGRITGEQIEKCLGFFEQVWSERNAWVVEEDRWLSAVEKLSAVPNWTVFYQDSLIELVAKIIAITGLQEKVMEALASSNAVDALLDAVGELPDEPPEHPAAIPLAMALVGNLDAIAHYSRSINDMIRASRERGEIRPLFDALSVDSLISTMPFFQAAIRLGQLAGDPSTAEAVLTAIKGPHKARLIYPVLRWAEYLLRDQGAFEACTQDEIHELLVVHLRLYDDDSRLKDSKKSMFMLFRKWRNEAGI